MLSICIPVYNVDVTKLTESLLEQAKSFALDIEILIYDDGSKEEFKLINRHIVSHTNVVYKELAENKGCASIRNQMAKDAKYDSLLFIDSDSEINASFLQIYKGYLNKFMILCGGRVHPIQLPSSEKSLRWIVGKKREDHNVITRCKVPNKSFMSNNFMVKKKLFDHIKFDETIERSGHEDTMMGIELESKGIVIKHIDNPVTHIGLEDNKVFITKTKQRTETLLYLLQEKQEYNDLMRKRIKLLKYFYYAKMIGAIRIAAYTYKMLKERIENNLESMNPNLFLFDLYKLGYLSHIF